jgi:tryptophanyl-tRNA synthetase
VATLEEQFAGSGYGKFKDALADVLIENLAPIRERIFEFQDNPEELRRVLTLGTQRAREVTVPTMARVREVTGLSLR